jgi:hypothetical protein
MVNILKYLKPKSKLINYKMGKPLSPNLLELRNFSDKGKVWENIKLMVRLYQLTMLIVNFKIIHAGLQLAEIH